MTSFSLCESEDSDLRCLSLWQPWATLVAIGAKRIETRPWSTEYRGWMAIHATKGESRAERDAMGRCSQRPFFGALVAGGYNNLDDIPHGAIIALTRLVDVQPTLALSRVITPTERAFGNYTPGRFGFVLDEVRPLARPIPCGGNQQLWIPTDLVRQQLCEAVAA